LWTPIIQASCQSTTKNCEFGDMNKFFNPKFTFRGETDIQVGWGLSQIDEEDDIFEINDLTPNPDQYMIFKIGDVELPMMICEHKIYDEGDELEKVTVKSFLLVSGNYFNFNLI